MLRKKYEEFKSLPLGLQTFRITAAIYASFTIWNILIADTLKKTADTISWQSALFVIIVVFLGIFLQIALMLFGKTKLLYTILPIFIFGFYWSLDSNSLLESLLTTASIPIIALLIAHLSRQVVIFANRLNRL